MNQKQPPLAEGLPVLGSAVALSQDTVGFLVKQYQQLGPVFRVRALNRQITVIAGQEANQFMARNPALFRSREFWEGNDAELGAKRTLISMDGPDHKKIRGVQKNGYGRQMLESQLERAIDILQTETSTWIPGSTRPVMGALRRIITEQLGQIVAGYSPGDYLDDVIYFIRLSLMTRVLRYYPSWVLWHPRYRRAKARTQELGQKVMNAHRQGTDLNSERDIVDHVLALAEEEPDFLPPSDVMPAVLGPYIAGLDTAASTLGFVFYALFEHPDLLEQVKAEVETLFAAGTPTAEALGKMDVLHRTVMETLRRYPIAGALQRTATQDFEFGGYTIKEGESVLIATTVPHFLPEFYPDPYRFDIDRYIKGREEHRKPGAFAPFGLGAHTCLGAGMAEVLIMVNAAALLHSVDVVMDPPNYQLKIDPVPTPSPNKQFCWRVVKQRVAART